jgi:hypothetical protein
MLQTHCIVTLTCRARKYKPNATWTGQIGVKTSKMQAFEILKHYFETYETYFHLTQWQLRFPKKKAYSWKAF